MNETYAVDPEAMNSARELKLLLDQFGLQTGRFLVKFPHDWPDQIIRRLTELSPLESGRVTELFRARYSCLAPLIRQKFDPKIGWDNNAAIALERERAFSGVIGQTNNRFRWPSLEQILYEEGHALEAGNGAHIAMNAAAYMNCMAPLFRVSSEVTLVDPYFTLRTMEGRRCRRRWPVLIAMLKLADASGKCETVRLVLKRERILDTEGTIETLNSDIKLAIEEAGTSRVDIKHDLRDSLSHARYLLSIHGGLQFDHGFEEKPGSSNHIHWLTKPELTPLIQQFLPKTTLSAK